MKGIKKLLTGILAATMIMGASVTAYASAAPADTTEISTAAATNYTLTVKDARTDRSFRAYQIIAGDLSTNAAGKKVLSNVKWGTGVTKSGTELTKAELDEIEALSGDEAVRAYASGLSLSETFATSTGSAGAYTFSVPAGWYLIKETTVTDDKDDFTSAFMMEVVGDAEANVKGSKTTVEKKVQDINDSTSSSYDTDLKDSADYDIGDEIPYTLTATLGNNLTDYDTYKLIFTDEMSAGLTYVRVDSLTIDGETKDITNVHVGNGTANHTGYTAKTFTIDDVLALGGTENSEVVIKYTCQLNENAVVGSAGNPNYVSLQFSNNPDVDTEYGHTPEDVNIVFTYKLVVNKVNEKKEALAGAGFTLYKKVTSDVTGAKTGADIKATYTNPSVKAGNLKNDSYYVVAGVATTNANGDTFDFKGIDDGTYVLVETTIPTGYNAWDATEFIVSATHTDGDAPALTELSGGNELFSGNAGSVSLTDGTLTTMIINATGIILPSTGGIGTTIFYILGGILIVAGVAYFIVRRKANAK